MPTTLWLFLGASMALTFAPGPDNVFIVTQGIARGRRPAVLAAWGMCSGITVHTLAAAAGVSAVFYSSALAFSLVKYAGAAYLLYLAYKTIKERATLLAGDAAPKLDGLAMFRRGFLMNVLNPKVALFFLAFLPQFVSHEQGHVGLQMIVLGLLFMGQAVVIFTMIALFAGSVGELIVRNPKLHSAFAWISAGVFATLGLKLALTQR